MDAGYLCNLPIQPILEGRKFRSDIIFVLDSTRKRPYAIELKRAEELARSAGHKFPPIDYKKARAQNFSIFKDKKDKDCPVVIYIPLKKDTSYSKSFNPQVASYCSTTNFSYSKRQFKMLAGLVEHIVKSNKDRIWDVIMECK